MENASNVGPFTSESRSVQRFETDPSSLLSSRWPDDNLLTFEPNRHYLGLVHERLTPDHLANITRGPLGQALGLEVENVRMGVFTWDLSCKSHQGPVLLVVPRVLDEPAASGRARARVPELGAAHRKHFWDRGLRRYLTQPLAGAELPSAVPYQLLAVDPSFHTATFGDGRIRLDLPGSKQTWVVGLGPKMTSEVLVEIIAAIAYHYEPEENGGTTLSDFFLNDGDFQVKRTPQGTLALRLSAMRRRESGVSSERLLLFLTQLSAYEDFEAGGELFGIPTLISNPSLAFEGFCRGLLYRAQDLGQNEAEARRSALGKLESFAKSEAGHAYRHFVAAYLKGELTPSFGRDLRERWWQLTDLRRRTELAAVLAQATGSTENRGRAQALRALTVKLEGQIGSSPDAPTQAPSSGAQSLLLNDLSRAELCELLTATDTPNAEQVASTWLTHWPFRNFDHMLAEVPGAQKLRKFRGSAEFGSVYSAADESSLRAKSRPKERAPRLLANAETFGGRRVPPEEAEAALRSFFSFEEYMDAALQDEAWGYYATSVVIGTRGHFTTSPERLSPHYGQWLCHRAFDLYRHLLASASLSADEPFVVVEFGAGNGRLALDFLNEAKSPAIPCDAAELWPRFAAALEYRIYEKSARLHQRQLDALGDRAVVVEGDARTPGAALKRDFPARLKGLVLTNEVPDAFGVHKLLLTAEGEPLAGLVVPSVGPRALESLSSELAQKIRNSAASLRSQFSALSLGESHLLDRSLFQAFMSELACMPLVERERLSLEIASDELYVPARCFPELREHLARNLDAYAQGLAEEASGVVLYPNLHADRFIAELGEHLGAGAVLTIDYGQSTAQLIRSARRGAFLFRVYFDGELFVPRPNDPYARMGLQDLTADVNFSAMARAGESSGLSVLHYGPEHDLASHDLGELVRQGRHLEPHWAAFLGTTHFRILVQGPESKAPWRPFSLRPPKLTELVSPTKKPLGAEGDRSQRIKDTLERSLHSG